MKYMEPFDIQLDGQGPTYRQLYRGIRDAILSGRLPVGTRLPATRVLARERGCARNVVLLAYELLLSEGYVEGRVGAGTFTAVPEAARARPAGQRKSAKPPAPRLSAFGRRAGALVPRSTIPDDAQSLPYDFRYGIVGLDDVTRRVWRRLVHARAREPFEAYLEPQGHPLLLEALAAYLGRARGLSLDPSQMVIVNGSQQALDLVARTFVDPGDPVVMEDPGYGGARAAFAAAGAEVVPVATGPAGLALAAAPARSRRAKLVYVTPSHQFPLGHVMPATGRLALLAWARANGSHIIEDDYDSEYRYDGPPVQAVHALDQDDRTIYIGTLSKVLHPALRLGYLVAPSNVAPAIANAKWVADRHAPALLQLALADFLRDGHFERHLRRTRKRHATRRAALLDELARQFGRSLRIEGTNAGVHVVAWLPELTPARFSAWVDDCRARGAGVYPIAPYYSVLPDRPGVLLGFSALDEGAIREGVRRMAAAYRGLRS